MNIGICLSIILIHYLDDRFWLLASRPTIQKNQVLTINFLFQNRKVLANFFYVKHIFILLADYYHFFNFFQKTINNQPLRVVFRNTPAGQVKYLFLVYFPHRRRMGSLNIVIFNL